MEMSPMRLPLLFMLITAGCSIHKDQPSQIVHKAEQCGAGDLAGASAVAMQDWFIRHRACAIAIDELCKPVRASAPARWTNSTEGQICVAAAAVTQWSRRPNADHERFRAGWK
jgi:hypothetical protein